MFLNPKLKICDPTCLIDDGTFFEPARIFLNQKRPILLPQRFQWTIFGVEDSCLLSENVAVYNL